jgi:hypothetical protein
MKPVNILITMTAALGFAMSAANASVVVGTYSFEETQLADQVLSFSGTGVYNGTAYVNPMSNSSDITDTDSVTSPLTFLSTAPYPGYKNVSLGLGFSETNVINGSQGDLALFFLFNQAPNSIGVTLNGVTKKLSTKKVFDSGGTQQVADGVKWNGTTLYNVLVTVAEIDLGAFGYDVGERLLEPLAINLNQTGTDLQPVALSLAGAINTAVVPLPAAVWLFGSGLLGMLGVARRRRC